MLIRLIDHLATFHLHIKVESLLLKVLHVLVHLLVRRLRYVTMIHRLSVVNLPFMQLKPLQFELFVVQNVSFLQEFYFGAELFILSLLVLNLFIEVSFARIA